MLSLGEMTQPDARQNLESETGRNMTPDPLTMAEKLGVHVIVLVVRESAAPSHVHIPLCPVPRH